jgi:quinolinate synthase
MHIWPGSCHVHAAIKPAMVTKMREDHPQAEFLIHPECGCVTSCMSYLASGDIANNGTHILSTEGMIRHTEKSDAAEFVVATEMGVIHRMRQAAPHKQFHPIDDEAVCRYMKMITLEKVLHSLREMRYVVQVPTEVAQRARSAIDRMLALS